MLGRPIFCFFPNIHPLSGLWAGMKLKQISAVKVKPSYGYQHPECGMRPPEGVPADETLCFEIQLVQWYPAEQVIYMGEQYKTWRQRIFVFT